MGGLKEVSFRGSWFAWLWWPLEGCKRCLSFPSQTSWSKWFQRFLQFFVVCLCSWWYWQYRLWLRFMESPTILFGHLKNSSFLIFSKTCCTGSLNMTLTFCVLVDPYCPVKSFLGLLLLYRFDLKSLPFWGITFSFPFPYSWSSSTLLYLSIWSISWRTLVTGLPVKDFLKPCSVGRPLLKVLMATSSKLLSISLYISQYLSEYAFRVSPSCMDNDNNKLKGRGTLLFIMKQELAKSLGELLIRIYGVRLQAVEPPHCYRS